MQRETSQVGKVKNHTVSLMWDRKQTARDRHAAVWWMAEGWRRERG